MANTANTAFAKSIKAKKNRVIANTMGNVEDVMDLLSDKYIALDTIRQEFKGKNVLVYSDLSAILDSALETINDENSTLEDLINTQDILNIWNIEVSSCVIGAMYHRDSFDNYYMSIYDLEDSALNALDRIGTWKAALQSMKESKNALTELTDWEMNYVTNLEFTLKTIIIGIVRDRIRNPSHTDAFYKEATGELIDNERYIPAITINTDNFTEDEYNTYMEEAAIRAYKNNCMIVKVLAVCLENRAKEANIAQQEEESKNSNSEVVNSSDAPFMDDTIKNVIEDGDSMTDSDIDNIMNLPSGNSVEDIPLS